VLLASCGLNAVIVIANFIALAALEAAAAAAAALR
jgi:hypothetical protein